MQFNVKTFGDNLPYKLDQFQIDACEYIIDEKSVLVCAPTSSGKTTVATFAQNLALYKGYKCFYTTPIKALSNQIYNECVEIFGKEAVGLLTGDRSINPDAQLIVMTTEVLRNMIYANSQDLQDLKYVVLDEVHYLQDASRGAVWEEVIVHLPKQVQLVCLSATISNYDEVADWVASVRGNCQVVFYDHRPVPLNKYFSYAQKHKSTVISQVDKKSNISKLIKFLNKKRYYLRSPKISELVEIVVDEKKVPAIFFIFSRKQCNELAVHISKTFGTFVNKDESIRLRELADSVTNELSGDDILALELDNWTQAFTKGVTPHHAGLIPQVRIAVETAIKKGLVKIVFATETLALGLNMPTKTVVLHKFTKFDGFNHKPLTSGELAQLSGRAGRRGIDDEGDLIVNWNHRVEAQKILNTISSNEYRLKSAFKPTYNMALNLVNLYPLDEIERLLSKSFAQYDLQNELKFLYSQRSKIEHQINSSKKRKRSYLLRKEENLNRKIDEKKLTLSNQFLNILNLLQKRDFLEIKNNSAQIAEKGVLLTGLSTEADLFLTEMIYGGVLKNISAPNLCVFISWICYNSRGDISGQPPITWPNEDLFDLYIESSQVSVDISRDERKFKVFSSRSLDYGITYPIYNWTLGKDLYEVVGSDLMGGDFVKTVLNIIDILTHISNAVPEYKAVCLEAKQLLNKDIIQQILAE